MRKLQMVDLKSQYDKIKTTVEASIQEVLDTTTYINGPKVHEFQKNLEEYLNPDLRVVPPPYVAKPKQPKQTEMKQEIVIPNKNQKKPTQTQSTNNMQPPSGIDDPKSTPKGNTRQDPESQMMPPSPNNPKKG